MQACHLGADAARDLHHQVGFGGHDTIKGEHGNTTGADFVGLLLVGQWTAQAGFDGGDVDLVAAQVRGVDALDLAQLVRQYGPGGGDDVE